MDADGAAQRAQGDLYGNQQRADARSAWGCQGSSSSMSEGACRLTIETWPTPDRRSLHDDLQNRRTGLSTAQDMDNYRARLEAPVLDTVIARRLGVGPES
jgi:hypothetical protein